MIWKHWAAVTLLAATANLAPAQSTFRLLSGDAPTITALGTANTGQTMTLELNDANKGDTESVWWRGGGYRGGFYRGGWGWGWGYSRAAFYRPYFYPGFALGFGYYRPWVSYSVAPYYYYSAPPVYYYSAPPAYYYSAPVGVSVSVSTPKVTASFTTMQPERISAPVNGGERLPPPQPVPGGPAGTYPYDGGPIRPVPMPTTVPEKAPPPSVPLEGRAVSLPAKPVTITVKYSYPAYGEQSVVPVLDRILVKKEAR